MGSLASWLSRIECNNLVTRTEQLLQGDLGTIRGVGLKRSVLPLCECRLATRSTRHRGDRAEEQPLFQVWTGQFVVEIFIFCI